MTGGACHLDEERVIAYKAIEFRGAFGDGRNLKSILIPVDAADRHGCKEDSGEDLPREDLEDGILDEGVKRTV